MECIFCNIPKEEILFENDLAIAFFDSYPVSKGHTLIIPKRHSENYFELTSEEIAAMLELSKLVKEKLEKEFHPDGYNVGFNVQEAGGQTVMHTHMHIIPRYKGDIDNPRGGIRKVIKKTVSNY